jgi:2-methylcitrate dehydratase PrpD
MQTKAPTLELAGWVSRLRYEQLPTPAVDTVRKCLLDAIGCGIYGRDRESAAIVSDWVEEAACLPSGYRGATAWGDERPAFRPHDAALVNGVAVHALELDDFHNAKLHPGAAIIPAAMAVAEHVGAGGKQLLTAIAAGYEVMIRTSKALNPTAARLRGWHLTGVCGPLGAAAAAASLLGLDQNKTAWALGLAGTQGSGLWAFNADGAMSKSFHAGRAAQSGVMAAQLARRGFSGPTQLYEAADGSFLRAYSDSASAQVLTARLGEEYHLCTIGIKPYAACASTHAYIDAALALRERFGAKLADIQALKIGCTKVVDIQCGYQYVPATTVTAQMSVRYCVASTLLRGLPAPMHFDPPFLSEQEVVALAQSIAIERSQELEDLFPEHLSGWLSVQLGGKWERADVIDPVGSQGNPIEWNGIVSKFRTLLARHGSPEQLGNIVDLVARVEDRKCGELTAAMRGLAKSEEGERAADRYEVAR